MGIEVEEEIEGALFTLKDPTTTEGEIIYEDGMIIVESDAAGWYSFEFDHEEEETQVFLHVKYCSEENRPVTLTLNEEAVEVGACADITGCFIPEDFATFKYGPHTLKQGTNSIKVTCDEEFFPHLNSITVAKA